MKKDDVMNEYFDWLCSFIVPKKYEGEYRKLLVQLFDTPFYYTISLDDNRAKDGVDLRYRFGDEHNYHHSVIATYLDDDQCTVLEMMVALAIRCENIMYESRFGDRTSKWFWDMIYSMGLYSMTNERYEKSIVTIHLDNFMNHAYEYNGKGGLVTLTDPPTDLRTKEIWYQVMWRLNEFTEGKK